jgi:hypothetical protein
MPGDVSDRKRLISITKGNLRNNHIYLSGHHDFFPPQCYGGPSARSGIGRRIRILAEGLPQPVETDIATDRRNCRPRNFFRKRAWVRRFFEKHGIREGDVVALERVDTFTFRLYPFETRNVRAGAAIPDHWPARPDATRQAVVFGAAGACVEGLRRKGVLSMPSIEDTPHSAVRDSRSCGYSAITCSYARTAGRTSHVLAPAPVGEGIAPHLMHSLARTV